MMFEKIKNKLGFGIMRLPMTDGEYDKEKLCSMVDLFMKKGFNYFDTAHGYMEGKSELAVRECITKRYPRESFVLADKLSDWFFEKEEDILPLFEKQLENCGVDYFDFYLVHALDKKAYEKHKNCNTFNILNELKAKGKIKHIAMSFHDSASVLDMILTEQPFFEAVQLQFNYLDYDDPTVQSKACYDVAEKHGKKIIVMEPVRGGVLANLPADAKKVFDKFEAGSPASFALRFVASHPGVFMVLSGMTTPEMIEENTSIMLDFKPLGKKEFEATSRARELIRQSRLIPCTKCNYCLDVCPSKIPVSKLFSTLNAFLGAQISKDESASLLKEEKELVMSCIDCGQCEEVCPQKIDIRQQLEKIKKIIK